MRSDSSQNVLNIAQIASISEAILVSIVRTSGKPLDDRHRQIVLEEIEAAIILEK
jgi:hypothetical protein